MHSVVAEKSINHLTVNPKDLNPGLLVLFFVSIVFSVYENFRLVECEWLRQNQLHIVQSSLRILREMLRLDLHKMNGNIMETIKGILDF